MILVLFMYLLMASTFTLAKAAIAIVAPIFFTAVRMILAGVLLLGYVYFFKPSVWKFSREDNKLFIAIAVFHIYLVYVLEFWGMQTLSSSKACLLYNLTPFITALLVYFLYHERLSRRKWAGLLIGFIGMLPVMWRDAGTDDMCKGLFVFTWADIALLGAVASGAYGWLVVKQLVVDRRYSPLMVNGIGMLAGGILALFTSMLAETRPLITTLATTKPVFFLNYELTPDVVTLLMAAVYLIALIIIANVIGYNLYGYLLHHYSATFLSFAGCATPLFAGLLGWTFLHEPITLPFVITFIMTCMGLYIFYKDELIQRRLES